MPVILILTIIVHELAKKKQPSTNFSKIKNNTVIDKTGNCQGHSDPVNSHKLQRSSREAVQDSCLYNGVTQPKCLIELNTLSFDLGKANTGFRNAI